MPKAYAKEFPQQARELRGMGFTFKEIAGLMGVPLSTVIFWAHDVPMPKDGRSLAWMKLSDLASYLTPGAPFKELPLPSGVIAWLQKQAIAQQPAKTIVELDSRKKAGESPESEQAASP